ncbi:DUF4317 domain-containing protein [Blautia parvula]|uniref:DUF4317 family protein n=1 Tax=Blautia TaxID=572511 RepID=UPI001CD92A26|nr:MULTISPECIES: DUF4317 family protein [Blautia]MCB4352391.1 DUF4317 domain-containing protein [Blautia sp. RD014232]UBU22696.1 DUF4317 domain-containing protein [Blautia parvula]
MINREDMLELTRRMTPARTSMTRAAGSYMDADGDIDGTFNTNFLKLSPSDKGKNLAIAKAIPFSATNKNLKRYRFPEDSMKAGSMRQLLMGMKSCGLKNDVLMETFYDLIAESYESNDGYVVLVYHDRYDVPVKAADHERVGESEEVFEYIICAICPLEGDYEPGKPECGFLFPAFADRSADVDHIDVFQSDTGHPHLELLKILGL